MKIKNIDQYKEKANYYIENDKFNGYIIEDNVNQLNSYKNFAMRSMYDDNYEKVDQHYNYFLVSKEYDKPIITVSSQYYSERFLKGLVKYFAPLLNMVDHAKIQEILSVQAFRWNNLLILSRSCVTTNNAENFINHNIDKDFTQEMIAEFLIYYSYFYNFKNADITAQEFLKDDRKYKFFNKKFGFLEELDLHKVYSILNPVFHSLSMDEIMFCYYINERNDDNKKTFDRYISSIEQIKINYKVFNIKLYKLYKNDSYKNVLIKDYKPKDSKTNKHIESYNIDMRRILSSSLIEFVSMLDAQYTHDTVMLENFLNNITISDFEKIDNLLYVSTMKDLDYFINEKYFVDFLKNAVNESSIFTNYLDDYVEVQRILKDVNAPDDTVNVLTEVLYVLLPKEDNVLENDSKAMLAMFYVNCIKELYSTGDLTISILKDLEKLNYNYYMVGRNPNIYIIFYLMKRFTNAEILHILLTIIDMDENNISYTDMMKFIDNYDEYKDMPISWALELVTDGAL